MWACYVFLSFFSLRFFDKYLPGSREEKTKRAHTKKNMFSSHEASFTFIYIRSMFADFFVLFRLLEFCGIQIRVALSLSPRLEVVKSESVASICPFKSSFALCAAPWKIEC
jgi:hypothetical protein